MNPKTFTILVMIVDFQADIDQSYSEQKQKLFAGFSVKIFKNRKIVIFFLGKICQFRLALAFLWGHVSCHKKLGPQSVQQLNVNWIQIN